MKPGVLSLLLRHAGSEHRVSFAAVDAVMPQEFLSESEKMQLGSFQFAAKRESFLLGRLAAKRALGALLPESDLRRIEIRSGIYGQPLVHHPAAGAADVSVSHSHGLAVALAFPAAYPMGIDLETVSAVSAQAILGELQASGAEHAWLAAAGVDQGTACAVLWTAREALGKALKIGLNSPLGVLSLGQIAANSEVSGSEGSWVGHYLNFPRFQCLSQARGGRVLSLAMDSVALLSGSLRFV